MISFPDRKKMEDNLKLLMHDDMSIPGVFRYHEEFVSVNQLHEVHSTRYIQ